MILSKQSNCLSINIIPALRILSFKKYTMVSYDIKLEETR